MLRPFPSSMRAAANTPAEPVGACVVRFPTGDSLPRYQGGSASASNLSRPARRSLALRPAWSLSRPWRPVTSECFRRCRCLHHPLRLLPAGATVAGRDSHPLKNGALHGAPDKPSYVTLARLQCSSVPVEKGSYEEFCVLHHPTRDYEAVKMGFCWPAFFFTFLWTFCKRLWGVTAVLVVVIAPPVVAEVMLGGTTSGGWGLITPLLLGMYGNRWRRWRLGKKGYEAVTIIEAVSPDRAITAYKTQYAD